MITSYHALHTFTLAFRYESWHITTSVMSYTRTRWLSNANPGILVHLFMPYTCSRWLSNTNPDQLSYLTQVSDGFLR